MSSKYSQTKSISETIRLFNEDFIKANGRLLTENETNELVKDIKREIYGEMEGI